MRRTLPYQILGPRWLLLIATGAAALVWDWQWHDRWLAERLNGSDDALLAALVSVDGVLLGFAIAIPSLVLSALSSWGASIIRTADPAREQLWSLFFGTARVSLLAMIVSALAITMPASREWVGYIVAFVHLLSVAFVFRAIGHLERVVRSASRPEVHRPTLREVRQLREQDRANGSKR